MKITLCGSVKFAKNLVEIYGKLEEMGHQPVMHKKMFGIADGTATSIINGIKEDHAKLKRQEGFIKWWYDSIKNSDAILVLNYDKNNIKNYIGGNTLMEIGFAHVLGKKIFLLNPIPEDISYTAEIKAMADVILNNDLSNIE